MDLRVRPAIVVAITAGAAILVAVTLWGIAGSDPSGAPSVLDVLAGIGGVAIVPVMLTRRPVPGALAGTLLMVISSAATPAASIGTLIVARRCRFPVAVGVAAAGVVAQGLLAWSHPPGLPYGWWMVLVVLGEAALVGWGAWAQARHALIVNLARRAHRAEDEQAARILEGRRAERLRIAREMHDVLAHRLSLVAASAGAIQYRPDASPEQLARAAGVVRDGAHQALEELREVIGVLREDPLPDRADNSLAPQPTLADLERLVEESRRIGVDVSVDDETIGTVHGRPQRPVPPVPPVRDAAPAAAGRQGSSGRPGAATGRTAYRVIQEGLTNARKHATGQPVRVVLRGSPGTHLELEMSNPMPPSTPAGSASSTTDLPAERAADPPGAGFGLVGLRERVQLAGGRLDNGVTGGNRFRLRVWLPWPPDGS